MKILIAGTERNASTNAAEDARSPVSSLAGKKEWLCRVPPSAEMMTRFSGSVSDHVNTYQAVILYRLAAERHDEKVYASTLHPPASSL